MYKSIVVGTDGSATANQAVAHALDLARMSGATLHLVHAHKLVGTVGIALGAEAGVPAIDVSGVNDAIIQDSQRVVTEVTAHPAAAGVTVETYSLPGDAAEALIGVAERVDADLIVVGNRGMTGAKRFVLGSVPNKVSHHCPCSLLIVQTTG